MQTPLPRIVVACGLITDGVRLLIAKRCEDVSFPGCWEFPGGKPETGESLEVALIRECKEEVDLDVEVVRQVARVNYLDTTRHLTLEVFLCKVSPEQEPKCIEVADLKWILPPELLEYQFPPANSRLVVQLAALEWGEWVDHGTQLWI